MNEYMSDFKIICGEKQFLCHIRELTYHSQFFRNYINFANDIEKDSLEIDEDNIQQYKDLVAVLRCIYHMPLDMNNDKYTSMLRACDYYSFNGIMNNIFKHYREKIVLNLDIITMLMIDPTSEYINEKFNKRYTCLAKLCHYNKPELVSEIINHPNFNPKEYIDACCYADNPMHICAKYDRIECLKILMKNKLYNEKKMRFKHETKTLKLFQFACINNSRKCAIYLIQNTNVDITSFKLMH